MSFNYANTAATADRLIKRFGTGATLRRTLNDGAAYDPATATVTAPTVVDTPCSAVVIDYDQKMIDGTLIRVGDKRVYMSAVGVGVPFAGDLFVWQSVTYSVMSVKLLAPSGVNVFYELQVRTP